MRSASAHLFRSDPENRARPSLMAARRPTSVTPMPGERVEVEGRPLGRAAQLHRRHAAGPHDVVDLVVALVEDAARLHPPVDVAVAVHAGASHVLAHRQGDGAARAADLVGDLHAGRRCTDDEHAALGELARIAVLHRRQRRDGRRHRLGVVGHPRHVERAGRDHDGRALPLALIGDDAVAAVGGAKRHDRGAGLLRGRRSLAHIAMMKSTTSGMVMKPSGSSPSYA